MFWNKPRVFEKGIDYLTRRGNIASKAKEVEVKLSPPKGPIPNPLKGESDYDYYRRTGVAVYRNAATMKVEVV